jgi:hypothetical protein
MCSVMLEARKSAEKQFTMTFCSMGPLLPAIVFFRTVLYRIFLRYSKLVVLPYMKQIRYTNSNTDNVLKHIDTDNDPTIYKYNTEIVTKHTDTDDTQHNSNTTSVSE